MLDLAFPYLKIHCNIFLREQALFLTKSSPLRFFLNSKNSYTFISLYSIFGVFITFLLDSLWQIKHKLYLFSVFCFFHGVNKGDFFILK